MTSTGSQDGLTPSSGTCPHENGWGVVKCSYEPGCCDQPAAPCEVHHVTHLADGGTTSAGGCALYCFFHHHVAIHQWGWTVALHPDGTTTARSPDGTKVFHSHSPPTARAG